MLLSRRRRHSAASEVNALVYKFVTKTKSCSKFQHRCFSGCVKGNTLSSQNLSQQKMQMGFWDGSSFVHYAVLSVPRSKSNAMISIASPTRAISMHMYFSMALQISSRDTCAKLSAAETQRVLLRMYQHHTMEESVVVQIFESYSAVLTINFSSNCTMLIKCARKNWAKPLCSLECVYK